MGDDDDVPIRDYVDHIYHELQSEIDRRVTAQEAAIDQAARDLSRRLDGMNEFRQAIDDLMTTRVSRELFDEHLTSAETRMRALEIHLSEIRVTAEAGQDFRRSEQGKLQRRVLVIGLCVSGTGVIIAIVSAILTHVIH